MDNENNVQCCDREKKIKYSHESICGGGVYGLAFVGALVYFIQNADSFKMILIGIFKAIFWPAFLIYNLLVFLGM